MPVPNAALLATVLPVVPHRRDSHLAFDICCRVVGTNGTSPDTKEVRYALVSAFSSGGGVMGP